MLPYMLLKGFGNFEAKLVIDLESFLEDKIDATCSDRLCLESLTISLDHKQLSQFGDVVSLRGKMEGHGKVLRALLVL